MNKTEARKILYATLGTYLDKGSELLFACPSCNHHKNKFSINLDKNAFKCWICDYRGSNSRNGMRSQTGQTSQSSQNFLRKRTTKKKS
jgi:hypothetical protein